jgi:hypothetical protein
MRSCKDCPAEPGDCVCHDEPCAMCPKAKEKAKDAAVLEVSGIL